jgi:methylmalonyl-CoA mutase N-terminal domain/subunit
LKASKRKAGEAEGNTRQCGRKIGISCSQKKEAANENSIEPILNAVKQYATVGEIFDTLKSVHGAYREGVRYY